MNLAMSMFLQYFCHTLNKTKKIIGDCTYEQKNMAKSKRKTNFATMDTLCENITKDYYGISNKDMQQQSRKHKFFIALYCTKSRIVNKRFSQTAKTWVFTQ